MPNSDDFCPVGISLDHHDDTELSALSAVSGLIKEIQTDIGEASEPGESLDPFVPKDRLLAGAFNTGETVEQPEPERSAFKPVRTGFYFDDDALMFRNLPDLLDVETLKEILSTSARLGVDDTVLASDQPLSVKLHGRWRFVTDRFLRVQELYHVLDVIHMKSSSGKVRSGEPAAFAYSVPIDHLSQYRFRFDATPIIGSVGRLEGISMTARTIPSAPPTVEELGVPQPIIDMCQQGTGVVIVTGPTGSGKTTLLFALLRMLGTGEVGRKIITFEAPVEFDLKAVPNLTGPTEQTDISSLKNGWADAAPSALRRNPCIVLIGEARDRESMEGVFKVSQTGKFVMNTQHTNSVAGTISRMADEFPLSERSMIVKTIISSLRGVIHQRLVWRPDGKGRTPVMEWLSFTNDVRRELSEVSVDGIAAHVTRMVEMHGHPLIDDVETKYQQGLIHEDEYQALLRELA